jgi:Mg2+/Co2+ transporter CorC
MGDPYRARPLAEPIDFIGVGAPGSRTASTTLRLRGAVHRSKLTHQLARGADPLATDELAHRARQLIGERNRKMLARSLRRTIVEAHRPAMTRARMVIINRVAALEAQKAIEGMIERLVSPHPVRAKGMALLERILSNADRSPLYNSSESGALRRTIRAATAALDGESAESHEFALAA